MPNMSNRGSWATLLGNPAKYKLHHLKYARKGHWGTSGDMPAPSVHPSMAHKYHCSYIAEREMIMKHTWKGILARRGSIRTKQQALERRVPTSLGISVRKSIATFYWQLPCSLDTAVQIQNCLIKLSFILSVNVLNEEDNPHCIERCLHSAN